MGNDKNFKLHIIMIDIFISAYHVSQYIILFSFDYNTICNWYDHIIHYGKSGTGPEIGWFIFIYCFYYEILVHSWFIGYFLFFYFFFVYFNMGFWWKNWVEIRNWPSTNARVVIVSIERLLRLFLKKYFRTFIKNIKMLNYQIIKKYYIVVIIMYL